MFDRFTYKQKNYGLLILFIVLSIVSYKRSISLTFMALNEIELQESRIINAQHAENDLMVLNSQINFLNKSIGKSNIPTFTVQKNIVKSVTSFNSLDIKLDKVESTQIFETLDFVIYTNQIIIKGPFADILQYVFAIENTFNFARVASVKLYSIENYQTKKRELFAQVLFQNFKQK